MAWQALVDGYAHKSSLQPILATPKRCKDAKELKERLTAWSLKVAEYEHQFKVIDEAQKIFVVREMMPKDIKREFLTGPRKFDEIMEKLEIIVNEMMPMMDQHRWTWVMSVRATRRRHRVTRTRATTCHTKTCVPSLGRGTRPEKEQAKKGPNGSGTWHRGKGADEWTNGKRDDGGKKGGKKGPKGSKPDWYGDKDKGGNGSKGTGKGEGKGKIETRYCYDYGEQGHIGVICPSKWANSIDEEDDQTSSWESEIEGEKAERGRQVQAN